MGALLGVTLSSAGDTRLGMWGCWGQEDPGRAQGRLDSRAELGRSLACTGSRRSSAGKLQEQSVLLQLGLQSKAGGGTGWEKSPKARLMVLCSTHTPEN